MPCVPYGSPPIGDAACVLGVLRAPRRDALKLLELNALPRDGAVGPCWVVCVPIVIGVEPKL